MGPFLSASLCSYSSLSVSIPLSLPPDLHRPHTNKTRLLARLLFPFFETAPTNPLPSKKRLCCRAGVGCIHTHTPFHRQQQQQQQQHSRMRLGRTTQTLHM
ncbi:hypothetical protein LZ31DRAFT_557186, partial [Colletotrichum somersetense]